MGADDEFLPNEALRAVASMVEAFDTRSVRYALIGGLAIVLRGRPRFNQGVSRHPSSIAAFRSAKDIFIPVLGAAVALFPN